MELCLHLHGKENVYLRIPTFWDIVENQWIGFIKTPKTKKIITGKGKDSFELQNDFNLHISEAMHSSPEMGEEIFSMFMPAWFWEQVTK